MAADPTADPSAELTTTLAEIEEHVHAEGWDRPPQIFALVGGTAYEQDPLPDGPLDEVLAGIEWPPPVEGCAITQEIVVLPPDVEAELGDDDAVAQAAQHPQRREGRLVVGVRRDGPDAAVLRLRGTPDEIVTGPDLAPNLVAALRATLSSAGPTGASGS